MRKLVLMMVILAIGFVSASEVYNIGFLELSDFVAGDTSQARVAFDFNDSEDNYNSQLILKVSINSSNKSYPVWREDFNIGAKVIESGFSGLFGGETELECHEAVDVNLTVEKEAIGDIHLAENDVNGTFYCYHEDTYRMNVDSSQEIVFEIGSNKAVYPGSYSFSVELLELEPTDFSLFKYFYGRKNCTDLNEWCGSADIDRSGKVDIIDFLWFKRNYGRTDCSENNSWCNNTDLNKDGGVESVHIYDPRYPVWRYNGSECVSRVEYTSKMDEYDYKNESECIANIPNETEVVIESRTQRSSARTTGIVSSSDGNSEEEEEEENETPEEGFSEREEVPEEGEDSAEDNFFSAMTGAVIGTLGTGGTIFAGGFLFVALGGLGFVAYRRRKLKN